MCGQISVAVFHANASLFDVLQIRYLFVVLHTLFVCVCAASVFMLTVSQANKTKRHLRQNAFQDEHVRLHTNVPSQRFFTSLRKWHFAAVLLSAAAISAVV